MSLISELVRVAEARALLLLAVDSADRRIDVDHQLGRARAVDEQGQVIDVLVPVLRGCDRRARRPDELITARAAALANVIVELMPDANHNTDQYATTGSNATTDG